VPLKANCGLEFLVACVEYKAGRSAAPPAPSRCDSASFEGLDAWRQCERWLDPRRLALGDALTRYRG
jgi:hypothetical protein